MEKKNRAIETFIYDIMNLYLEHEKYFTSSLIKKNCEKGIELVKEFRYALYGNMWRVDKEKNHSFLVSLLQVFLNHIPDYSRDIETVDTLFEKGVSESRDLVRTILANDREDLFGIARSNELSMEFMTFFSIFSAYGYRSSLSRAIASEYRLDEHSSGICPVCGQWPGIAYLTDKKKIRTMSCICCGTNWRFREGTCSFCLTTEKEKLGYLNVEGEERVSASVCENCRRYLKTVSIHRKDIVPVDGKPLIDYLNSSFIDIAAVENRYIQESLLGTRFDGPGSKEFNEYRKLMTGN
jgi:formate dehydrogenase maturation protein FdhE